MDRARTSDNRESRRRICAGDGAGHARCPRAATPVFADDPDVDSLIVSRVIPRRPSLRLPLAEEAIKLAGLFGVITPAFVTGPEVMLLRVGIVRFFGLPLCKTEW